MGSLCYFFFSKCLQPFKVVVLNTQAETARLTTPTLQLYTSPAKNPQKLTSCSAWECKLRPPHFFSALWVGARAPTAPPGYAYGRSRVNFL